MLPLHTLTHHPTDINKLEKTTTGEDKCAKHIPHVNKHRALNSACPPPPAVATNSLHCLGLRPLAADGRESRRRTRRSSWVTQPQTFCPALSSAALTLHHSHAACFNPSSSAPGERCRTESPESPSGPIRGDETLYARDGPPDHRLRGEMSVTQVRNETNNQI